MKQTQIRLTAVLFFFALTLAMESLAQRQMENLGRGSREFTLPVSVAASA